MKSVARIAALAAAGLIGSAAFADSWIGDAGHFITSPAPGVLLSNPKGEAFTVTVHRHVWMAAGGWANKGDFKIAIVGPASNEVATGTIPSGAAEAVLAVPAGLMGTCEARITPGGYPLYWVESSLDRMVLACGGWEGLGRKTPDSPYERTILHAMVPRRWYFFVPAGTRRFTVKHIIWDSQTHREDYGFFIVSPRGQRVEAFFGGKSLEMSPTSGMQPGFTQRLVPVPVERTVEIDPGTAGRFWSVWACGGDSHNFADLTILLNGVPPYLAPSPEQWFDPATGLPAPRLVYDESRIEQPYTQDAAGKWHEPYPHYFCSPSPYLGDQDYNGWRGPHTLWLFNPEGRALTLGTETYLAGSQELTAALRARVIAPDGKAMLDGELPLLIPSDSTMRRETNLPATVGGVYRVDVDGARWFPWSEPATPTVMAGRLIVDGGARFGLEIGIARHWFFMVPRGVGRFRVAVSVKDPLHVLRVEIHAPDRMLEELAVRGGARREVSVEVPTALAGRIWFLRAEVGSATRFVSSAETPAQVNVEADIDLIGVPGYLAPTWEQWFDPLPAANTIAQ